MGGKVGLPLVQMEECRLLKRQVRIGHVTCDKLAQDMAMGGKGGLPLVQMEEIIILYLIIECQYW